LESPVPQNDSVIDFFFCEVCGEGRVIGATPGATVSIPGEEDEICYEVAEDGATGRIDRERCEKIKPYVEQSCGCQAKNPPCLVCGVGQTIIDANGVISFPGMREFHVTGGYCPYVWPSFKLCTYNRFLNSSSLFLPTSGAGRLPRSNTSNTVRANNSDRH
jgi:hypothetical protein